MAEGASSLRYSISVNPQLLSRASATLAETVPTLEKAALLGYLRWFAACSLYYRSPSGASSIDVPAMKTDDLAELVLTTRGSTREGAILLLKGSRDMDFGCLRSLLERSRDADDTGRAWAQLLQSRVEGQDSEEVVVFLEEVLSPASRFPRPIKHAARAAYQKMARTSTVDIKDQEVNLGLPFQAGACATM
jgi:hypothetical protein